MARRTSPEPPTDQRDAGLPGASAASEVERSDAGLQDASAASDEPAGAAVEPAAEPAFFAWLRKLDVQRRTGWLGGVCAGVAQRTGLDPILVRGIVVVLAVIGAPVVLLYALAWALLPDGHGTIHMQQLIRGNVTRALPGIIAVFLLSFLPVTQGFWYAGALYWGELGWGGALVRAVWTGVVLIAVTVLVVWLARRASGDPVWTPATTDDRPDTVPRFPADAAGRADTADAAAAGASDSASAADELTGTASTLVVSRGLIPDPGEPPVQPTDASEEELAAWKLQQEQWKQQRAEWAAEQRRTERERRQAEAHTRALEAASAASERARIRRLTRPRARAGVVFLVLGLGLVAAAMATLFAYESRETTSAAWIIGAATLVAVLGLGTVVVALCRRRSGALALFSVLAVFALAVSVVVPSDRQLLPPGASYGLSNSSGRYAQLSGSTSLWVEDRSGDRRVVDLWQLGGNIEITLEEGATVRVDATTDNEYFRLLLEEWLADDSRQYSFFETRDGRISATFGEGEPDVILKLWTRHAWVRVVPARAPSDPLTVSPEPDQIDRSSWEGEPLEPWRAGSTPTPTPVPTEGVAP